MIVRPGIIGGVNASNLLKLAFPTTGTFTSTIGPNVFNLGTIWANSIDHSQVFAEEQGIDFQNGIAFSCFDQLGSELLWAPPGVYPGITAVGYVEFFSVDAAGADIARIGILNANSPTVPGSISIPPLTTPFNGIRAQLTLENTGDGEEATPFVSVITVRVPEVLTWIER